MSGKMPSVTAGPVHGWAVVDGGKIDVRTVSPTRRAALVNWLVVNKGLVVTVHASDEQIERWWATHTGGTGIICTTVSIELTPR